MHLEGVLFHHLCGLKEYRDLLVKIQPPNLFAGERCIARLTVGLFRFAGCGDHKQRPFADGSPPNTKAPFSRVTEDCSNLGQAKCEPLWGMFT